MEPFAIVLVKSLVIFVALLTVFAYLVLLERKMLGYFHMRVGPNRTGPWGLLQPLADGVKAIVKEDIIPAGADKWVFRLAPVISMFTAFAAFAVIPLGPPIQVGPWQIHLGIADPPGGVLVLLAFTAMSVYGIALGGWASQSKYSLLGAMRSAAQMVSYELSLGISLAGVLMLAGSVRLPDIVAAQETLPFVVLQPLGFVVFMIAALAELNRVPFDLPEAETELVSGYSTEYSGMRWAMFMLAEYVNMITSSFLISLLYLGGWHGPQFFPPFVNLAGKAAVLLFGLIWLRASLPRVRYDRLMSFGWKVLLPLAVINLIATAVWVALR